MYRVGDVALTKALQLLCPQFIAVSDRYVRPSLGTRNPSYKLLDNLWYAERAVAVQRAVRLLGQENEGELAEPQDYAHRLWASARKLSKAHILDMVVWLGHLDLCTA